VVLAAGKPLRPGRIGDRDGSPATQRRGIKL